jgi:hypothetical protein
MMSKLTLSVDEDVIARAKRYAEKQGTSVSQLVGTYLDVLSRPPVVKDAGVSPSLRRLRGILKGVKFDREEYIDYLDRKYK